MDPRAAQRIADAFRARKDVRTLSPAEFNRELDKVDELRSKLTDAMIEAGRGEERPSDTAQYPFGRSDPLTVAVLAVSDRWLELRREKERRLGPGHHHGHLPRFAKPLREREENIRRTFGLGRPPARMARSEGRGANDWRVYLAPGEAQYVPGAILAEMPDVIARASAAGMPHGAEYMGAGMTGVVFCVGDVAYKVARRTRPIDHQMFEDEAEWLEAASRSPIAQYVARVHRFDPVNLVIERNCPRAGPDQSPYRYGEGRLFDLHGEIEREMIPLGWTAPEFKPDSYVVTARGPVLVDASMPSRVGQELAQYVEDAVSGRRELWNTSPHDLAFYVRREVGQTLSAEEARRLESMIERRWPGQAD